MSIRNKNDIKVYNEMPTQINLVGQHRSYVFPPAVDGVPSMNLVDFADIEYAHSRGIVFSAGLLVFDESERDEIYKELRINDWKDKVWFEKDIEDLIQNPTAEKMQRVLNITSLILIERIRGKVVSATNRNEDISNKVVTIVNSRYKEISSGIMKSKLAVKESELAVNTNNDKKVAQLEAELAAMKKLMEQMVAQNSANVEKSGNDSDVQAEDEINVSKPNTRNKPARQKDKEKSE